MKISWLGTASVELNICGQNLLFDPYFQKKQAAQNLLLEKAVKRADMIFVTHPHLDHFADISLISKLSSAPLYVCERGLFLAQSEGADSSSVRTLKAFDFVNISSELTVKAYPSAHCKFDRELIKKTAKRAALPLSIRSSSGILRQNREFSISEDDIFAYEIKGEGKTVFILGSAGLRRDISYPVGADVLLFPFQGRNDMTAYSCYYFQKLKPKKIILTHFDDAFPPISEAVDVREISELYDNLIVPRLGEEILL